MQNRYVADIGDYVKLAILRSLIPGRSLGVAWWLFPEEPHSTDGGHREYLSRPDEWRNFDEGLFDALLSIGKKKKRCVCDLENAAILPNTEFASEPVPCKTEPFALRPEKRAIWLGRIKKKLQHCNLIFLDPDNGIAAEGLKLTRRRAGKSVTIEEIKALQKRNRAMVIYHHQTRLRGGHLAEINNLATRLRKNGLHFSGALRAKPWSPRIFLILNGNKKLLDHARSVAVQWKDRITWHPEVEIPRSSK